MTRTKRRGQAVAVAAYGPTPERQQHDRVMRAGQMLDEHGVLSAPLRAESMLERMERCGDIGTAERDAGEKFQADFRQSQLDPLRAADLLREIRYANPHHANGIEAARRRINDAIQALGGHGSPCGSCAWFVLGVELSVADWARREGWGGKPLRPEVAKGTLLGTLGVLAAHFGLQAKKSA